MVPVRDAFYKMACHLGPTTIFGNPGSLEEAMIEYFWKDLD
jgi:hypothetical protein